MKTNLIVLMLAGLTLSNCGNNCKESSCSDYEYQEFAQADFDKDPDCYSNLDSDDNSIACEHLPSNAAGTNSTGNTGNNSGGCPTTANCGCSNKKKADCPSECCQWIVGDGCKCK